jgi:hypothetical protein
MGHQQRGNILPAYRCAITNRHRLRNARYAVISPALLEPLDKFIAPKGLTDGGGKAKFSRPTHHRIVGVATGDKDRQVRVAPTMAKKSRMGAIRGGCRGLLSSERGCLGVALSMHEGLLAKNHKG